MSETYVVHYSTKAYVGQMSTTGVNAKRRILDAILGGHAEGSIDKIDCYDTEEGWSRDVTEDLAREIASHVMVDGNYPPSTQIRDFVEEQLGVGTAIPAAA